MVDFWHMLAIESELIFGICGLFLFGFFLNRVLKVRKTTREILPFIGLTIGFFAWGISYIITSWRTYFAYEYSLNSINPLLYQILKRAEFLILWIMILFLVFLMEYSLKRTKYLITSYALIIVSIAIIIEHPFLNEFELIVSAPMFVALLILLYFAFIKPTSGSLRRRMYLMLVGFFPVALGLVFRNRIFNAWLGPAHTSIASAFAITGAILIAYGFAAFSTFSDLRWKSKLRELFVISAASGVSLYAYSFDRNIALEDTDLIAGGFSGMQTLLSEMMQTKESLQLIDYQNLKIMVVQGEHATFILILKEESSFLQYKLDLFANEFELFFRDALQNWIGELGVFQPTKLLIQRIFEVE